MKTVIYSRDKIEELIASCNFPQNAAAISFRDRPMILDDPYCTPVKYRCGVSVFHCVADDIVYGDFVSRHPKARNLSIDTFFQDATKMADFILEQAEKGIDIIVCQCEHGQSRSAAAAAAIEQFFNKDSISIFADYRYSPNQAIYNKLIKALITQNFFMVINGYEQDE